MDAIAFIGLGAMGAGMAHRLVGAGFPVTVYNRTPERAKSLTAAGAKLAQSPREAASGADIVIAMVADDDASRQVWLGDEGALAGMKRGVAAIECSTLTSQWVTQLEQAVKERGCGFLDAPVTGSKPQAAAGELRFLVGGDARMLERFRPVFNAMGREAIHLGAVGSGARMKLINNFLCGVQAAALGEAVAMIERGGLERDAALNILKNGAPGSPLVKGLSERMTARTYETNFALRWMQKDLRYAMAEAGAFGIDLRTAEAALKLFGEAFEKGFGDRDFSAVAEASR